MVSAWYIGLIGLIAGISGTALGGACSWFIKKPRRNMVGILMALSGGIMLIVVVQDLMPEALKLGGIMVTLLGLICGIGFMHFLHRILPNEPKAHDMKSYERTMFRASLLLGLGIAIHNIPEGLAIGAGYTVSHGLGLEMALVIALHNIPEGLAMAGPMRGAGLRLGHVMFWTGLAGVPMGIGALLGAVIGTVSIFFLSASLGFASGAMLYIIFDQLIPDALKLSTYKATVFATVFGIIAGFFALKMLDTLPFE